jgi:hypothetical protein
MALRLWTEPCFWRGTRIVFQSLYREISGAYHLPADEAVACQSSPRFSAPLPILIRRRYPERQDCRHVYYGDVHVGTIAIRAGIPFDEDPWGWTVGFYPGAEGHQDSDGTAATFDQARADFEVAWNDLLPTLTEADFDRWREARDWTARKYVMWDGEKFPSQKPSSLMRCPCGEVFDSHLLEHTVIQVSHITRIKQADAIRRSRHGERQ